VMDPTQAPAEAAVADFDYHLPPELIAQEPLERRDASRLLVLHRSDGRLEHRQFTDLPSLLEPGDCLVLNDTRVLRCRLVGRRADTGARMEVLLLREMGEGVWEALARPARRARPGARLELEAGAVRTLVLERAQGGLVRLAVEPREDLLATLERVGRVPLPPYITRPLADAERYQTVYARREGSAAAPTAGLHFTPEVLAALGDRGVVLAWITLHVGLGTFAPVRAERVADHRMHEEWYAVGPEAAAAVEAARARGSRVVAVGTTVCRTLETVAGLDPDGRVRPGTGWTDLFIVPGYRWRAVDALVTNFHLPRSTLLMLVSAFAGREVILGAYREAIRLGYRFYSFGDAMLIL